MPLTQPVDEYLGHFLTDLPYDFEELPEVGPNVRGFTGDMPLHIAACRGDNRAIELLLEAGADINARGEDDWLLMDLCGWKEVVSFGRL